MAKSGGPNIRPLSNKVLIQRTVAPEKSEHGIIILQNAQEKPLEGRVIAVGNGIRRDDGKILPMTVKEGDLVLLKPYSGTPVTLSGEEYQVLPETEILGIVIGD